MKKILMLGTGGTIACVPSGDGFVPGLSAEMLMAMVPGLGELAHIDCLELMSLDSSNMGPEHWLQIAEALETNYNLYDGFVITHGTDTMAYTAAALSSMLENCQKPVVITGAQLTMEEAGTDAKSNIYLSVQVAVSEVQGVCLAFGNQVIHGLWAKKICTENLNGFASINAEPLATVIDGRLQWHSSKGGAYGKGTFSAAHKLERKVAVVKITPGLDCAILDYYLIQGYRGLVLEGFGAGGVPNGDNNWLPALERLLKEGVRVICCTQCLYDGVHLDRYPMGILASRLGAESAGNMTVEAALCKLMVELAR